ncbi:MAG TPA: cytochrome P450, partial [Ktedonobacteraceae bacterium]
QIDDTSYVVSTYAEIVTLLHSPSSSKDPRTNKAAARKALLTDEQQSFLFLDPPEHDRLRELVIHQFTPERITGMHGRVVEIVTELLNGLRDQNQLDIVDHFAYPLPVTVICELLGVPREDEKRFHAWADAVAHSLDPDHDLDDNVTNALEELSNYMNQLIAERRASPRNDLVSGLALGRDPSGHMDDEDLIRTLVLLLIAGHETTVNLITNSMLTLLRHPQELQKLRDNPERVSLVVEEVLRYEPPVQFSQRFALTDATLHGITIPRNSGIWLMLASGNRDPRRFAHPDTFDPDRPDNEHLGFGSGIHYCVGAPLARIEAHVALTELVRRLVNPRLVSDPPPYRPNAVLRGPQHLPVAFDRIVD